MTKPLLRRKKVKLGKDDPIWVSLKYEKLPTFCYHCDILGHSERECRETEKMGRDNGGNTKAYGPWLRASLGRRKPVTTTITGGRSDSRGKNSGTSAPHAAPSQAETSVTRTKEKVTAEEAPATIAEKVTDENQNQGPNQVNDINEYTIDDEVMEEDGATVTVEAINCETANESNKKVQMEKKGNGRATEVIMGEITELAPNNADSSWKMDAKMIGPKVTGPGPAQDRRHTIGKWKRVAMGSHLNNLKCDQVQPNNGGPKNISDYKEGKRKRETTDAEKNTESGQKKVKSEKHSIANIEGSSANTSTMVEAAEQPRRHQ